jgi:hypothetical protein
MEKALKNYIIETNAASRAEMDANPGTIIGMLPDPSEVEYWAERVPTGTLTEYNRIEREETCYYMLCDAYSKSYARNLRLSVFTDAELDAEIEAAGNMIAMQREEEAKYEAEAESEMDELAASLSIDRPTLKRWIQEAMDV